MKAWKNHRTSTNVIDQEPVSALSPRDRAQKNGTLIDLSTLGEDNKIIYPVAITKTASISLGCSPAMSKSEVLDQLWNVVYLLGISLRRDRGKTVTRFTVPIKQGNRPKEINLKAVPSQDLIVSQVYTIMLENESLAKVLKTTI